MKKTDTNASYGGLVRKAREEIGLTVEECAAYSLLFPSEIQGLEENRSRLSHADLVLLCNVLNISAAALEEGQLIWKSQLPSLEELTVRIQEGLRGLGENLQYLRFAIRELSDSQIQKKLVISGLQEESISGKEHAYVR